MLMRFFDRADGRNTVGALSRYLLGFIIGYVIASRDLWVRPNNSWFSRSEPNVIISFLSLYLIIGVHIGRRIPIDRFELIDMALFDETVSLFTLGYKAGYYSTICFLSQEDISTMNLSDDSELGLNLTYSRAFK